MSRALKDPSPEGLCPGFSWDMVNFHKKLDGLTQTSQLNGIFIAM